MNLAQDGVVVIPSGFDVPALRAEFETTLRSLPCFKPNATSYVLGGFGALGSPGSFHNPFARQLRFFCLKVIMPHLRPLCVPGDHVEMLPGRMLLRAPGASPSAEMWHRDESPNALPGDRVLGGWINLGTTAHAFSCVLGTHIPGVNQSEATGATGFSRITKADVVSGKLKERRSLVIVNPGDILLFFENIIHEVKPGKSNVPMYRLHLAHRITQSATALIPNIDMLLDTQAPIPMKSAQHAPMYAALHWTNWSERIVSFSRDNIRDWLLEDRCRKKTGQTLRVVPRFMSSLEVLGLSKYPPYSDFERSFYHPRLVQ